MAGDVRQFDCLVGAASPDDQTHLDVRDVEQVVQCRQIVSVDEKLYRKRAGQAVALALGVEEATYLLVVDRVIFGLDGKPVEWLLSWPQFLAMYYGVMLG